MLRVKVEPDRKRRGSSMKGSTRSSKRGSSTSVVEVLGRVPTGGWLSVRGKEHFLPHAEFPWFRRARSSAVRKVELLAGGHLHRPELDVDLDLRSIEHPERFPLRAKVRPPPR
ncbi:MAG: DUF2442 domain-containing protein [Elusimicrobia bacterium]|nr:DUF2442 domain-containing protein [Elusimicrobiota bacterium]